MSQPSGEQPPISFGRILSIVLPVAIVGVGMYLWSRGQVTHEQEQMATNVVNKMFSQAEPADGKMAYEDKNGDLVADPPDDPKDCINPDELVFSFVASAEETMPEEHWKELFAALTGKTGKKVKFVHYTSADEQLAALKNDELHIAALNTGIVPTAVQRDGFVPLCTFGRDDGTFGYTMQFLVPADSRIKTIDDIRGHKVMFTRLDSNSGFKAPLVLLMDDQHRMMPDRDFQWGFSQAHEESIKRVADKEYEVAPVASDILSRMEDKGEVDGKKVRSIYESERFPPATIGIVYNLTPELRDSIRGALIGFELKGTGLDGEFGTDSTKLVPVSYKDDWANTRAIDKVVAQVRSSKK